MSAGGESISSLRDELFGDGGNTVEETDLGLDEHGQAVDVKYDGGVKNFFKRVKNVAYEKPPFEGVGSEEDFGSGDTWVMTEGTVPTAGSVPEESSAPAETPLHKRKPDYDTPLRAVAKTIERKLEDKTREELIASLKFDDNPGGGSTRPDTHKVSNDDVATAVRFLALSKQSREEEQTDLQRRNAREKFELHRPTVLKAEHDKRLKTAYDEELQSALVEAADEFEGHNRNVLLVKGVIAALKLQEDLPNMASGFGVDTKQFKSTSLLFNEKIGTLYAPLGDISKLSGLTEEQLASEENAYLIDSIIEAMRMPDVHGNLLDLERRFETYLRNGEKPRLKKDVFTRDTYNNMNYKEIALLFSTVSTEIAGVLRDLHYKYIDMKSNTTFEETMSYDHINDLLAQVLQAEIAALVFQDLSQRTVTRIVRLNEFGLQEHPVIEDAQLDQLQKDSRGREIAYVEKNLGGYTEESKGGRNVHPVRSRFTDRFK